MPIGGDDTSASRRRCTTAGFQTVGVPKTIDNDLSVTEFCIGFDTAVGVVTEALDRLHTTASAHHRVMVVEVMGRDAGWVALLGGLAGGADLIIIPEFPSTLDDVVAHLYRRRGDGKLFSIIVVAEGAKIPDLEKEAGGQAREGRVRPRQRLPSAESATSSPGELEQRDRFRDQRHGARAPAARWIPVTRPTGSGRRALASQRWS